MADKQISELVQATQITDVDLFVLEQDGTAKKLTGATLLDFVTLSVVNVTVTTLPAGSQATAVYDKATGVLSLGIPQGKQGVQGETGAAGATGLQGPANVLTIGSVTSGKVASATITGEAPNQVLNFVLEKGDKGETGPAGKDGITPEIVEGELVTVPSAGGSADPSLGVTGASIGQIIKVKAVDTDGKPTAWEAVDMATGGGETWEKIAEIELRADTAAYVLADFATWRKAKVIMTRPQYISGLNKNVWCKVVGLDGGDTYNCGYLSAEYGYIFWEFAAEVNELFITTEALESNNTQVASYVKSSGTFTPPKSPVGIYKFELSFVDTSVIQEGDKVTVIGVRR